MSIFFRFRDTQLRFVFLRHPFAEGVRQGGWRVCNGGFDVCGIFGQHDKIEVHYFLTGETVEIAVNKCTGDFTRAVCTEVHENQRVAVFHCRIGLAFGADHGGFHEFVVFVTRIGSSQAFNRGRELEFTFCQRHQVIGLFNAVPAVVAVHGVVTTNDRCHPAFAQGGKLVFKTFQ